MQEKLSPAEEIADGLHSAAIHLLRQLRSVDTESGLSGPRLSALSVIVFRGPLTVSELAAAEQVSKPTISNLVKALVEQGFVRRCPDASDGRIVKLEATRKGAGVLFRGKLRRVRKLANSIEQLESRDRKRLLEAIPIIQRISQPE